MEMDMGKEFNRYMTDLVQGLGHADRHSERVLKVEKFVISTD